MPDKKILILTASFGDGHNSAAYNLRTSLERVSEGGAVVKVCDLFKDGFERYEAFFKWGYQFLTNRFPSVWHRIYKRADRSKYGKVSQFPLRAFKRKLAAMLAEEQPDAVVSTYPMYPLLMADTQNGIPRPRLSFLSITDSITINRIWHTVASDFYFVTDRFTKSVIEGRGLPTERIFDTGFAVSPLFTELTAGEAKGSVERLLYFATTGTRHVASTLRSILEDTPVEVKITIVMGRHADRLAKTIGRLLAKFPARNCELIGWTKEVPRLLTIHDLVITKAGGATVHECLAAGTPTIINYVIPGQEEGNAQLVEKLGCGWRFIGAKTMGARVREVMESGRWLEAKQNAMRLRKPDGALVAAKIILDKLSENT